MKHISLDRDGLYVIFRYGVGERPASGFVVKLKSGRIFSERAGGWRGFCLGPLYFRTYARKEI